MSTKSTIIRAWKDKTFRASLSEEELQNLPPHPSGLIEVSDTALGTIHGGTTAYTLGLQPSTCWNDCGSPTYRGQGQACAL